MKLNRTRKRAVKRTVTSKWLPTLASYGAAFAAVLAAMWALPSPVDAHAAYRESSPAFAEVLDASPTAIEIRFSQELFRREGANRINLRHVDSGSEIALGASLVENEDRHLMRAELTGELAVGRYLVSWANLSAEDGDADAGAYPFYLLRQPTNEEVATDREIAAELLLAYPDDSDASSAAETAIPSVAPIVSRTATDRASVSLGLGPLLWLSVGLVAGGALVLLLARDRFARRREVD